MGHHRIALIAPRRPNLFELGVAVEIFGYRRSEPPEWYDFTVCSAGTGLGPSEGGLVDIAIVHGLEAAEVAETVMVLGSEVEPFEPEVLTAVRQAHERGARIVGLCTGAFVLAAAGVLDGRTATTHWKHAVRLARRHPRTRVHSDVLYVDDGQVLTSAGMSAAVDLCLHIIRKDHGVRVARDVARHLVMPPHREGGQAQYIVAPVPEVNSSAAGIQRVIEYLGEHLDQDLRVDDLAAVAYMSPRNFSRRFRQVTGTTPNRWILDQRLARARELLEETDESIEQVARLSGFGSPITMRQHFAQILHTSPSAYRRTFRTIGHSAAAGGDGTPVPEIGNRETARTS
ncbi:GlxA family transcriptional regulator [Actinomadura viridis]|uniref:GlxA family transcriptional regulator n=1 Tax=Actinomadura viridis TaxID=58110 RepID=UPI0036CED3BF